MSASTISPRALRRRLRINTRTGEITRLVGRGKGRPAGTMDQNGFRHVAIDGVRYAAARLVWFAYHGTWPRTQLLHLDGDIDNNAIRNLVELPKALHPRSLRRLRNRTSSGRIGVRRLRRPVDAARPFKALRGNRHLGYFATAEEAEAAFIANVLTDTARGGATQ